MKGLQQQSNDGIFLHIKDGSICEESKGPREGFERTVVTDRDGTEYVKYRKKYKLVEALIKSIDWYEREHNGVPYMGWKLKLDANGTICSLDLPFESRVGTRFMKLAENIDFALPVEFSAWKGADDKTAFSVKQNGENIPQKYTRENPGECPPPVQGFNKKWNYDDQKQFLHSRMLNVVIPMVKAANANGDVPEETNQLAEQSRNGHDNAASILEEIKKTITAAVNTAGETRGRAQLLEDYFGTRVWSEVEKMPAESLKVFAAKLEEDLIPF